jgi:hypothetical protein
MAKSFINWPRVANLNGVVIYCRTLTLENVGAVVNYSAIFIRLASGERKWQNVPLLAIFMQDHK